MAKRSRGGKADLKGILKSGAQLAGAAGVGFLGASFVSKQVDKQVLESQGMTNDTRTLIRAAVSFAVGLAGIHFGKKKISDVYRFAFAAGAGVSAGGHALDHSALADVADKIRSISGDESQTISIDSPGDIARVLHAVNTVSPARVAGIRQIAGTLTSPLNGTLSNPLSGDPFQSAYEGNLKTQLVGNAGAMMVRATA